MSSPTYKEFAEWVHDVLGRLYDSPHLETHSLADMLVGETEGSLRRSQRLRQIVIDAIRAMRPASGTPARSPDWRAYRILELRYLDGLSPTEVMNEVALGRSRYFQEQSRVQEAITRRLWDRWRELDEKTTLETDTGSPREVLAKLETERLKANATWEALDLARALDDLRPVIAKLAEARHVELLLRLPKYRGLLRADRVMLRQGLLNLLSYTLDLTQPGGQVELATICRNRQMILRVTAHPVDAGPALGRKGIGLDVCRQLMAAIGGSLHLQPAPKGRWTASLIWPRLDTKVLLVIDDNEDFGELFRRYLADQGWQVVEATGGAEARQLLNEVNPTAITLDVMMPKEDGWEILRWLQENEQARSIPVIVCSVLSEPRLATALGAVAYLSKPVAQQDLLQILARWQDAANQAPEP